MLLSWSWRSAPRWTQRPGSILECVWAGSTVTILERSSGPANKRVLGSKPFSLCHPRYLNSARSTEYHFLCETGLSNYYRFSKLCFVCLHELPTDRSVESRGLPVCSYFYSWSQRRSCQPRKLELECDDGMHHIHICRG